MLFDLTQVIKQHLYKHPLKEEHMEWFILLTLGACVGLLAGLFGIGGGLVLVPALSILLPLLALADEQSALASAIAIALSTIVITGLSAAITQIKQQKVDWFYVKRLAPSLAMGAIIGALLTSSLPTQLLGLAFGTFEILIAAYMFYGKPPQQAKPQPSALHSHIFGGFSGALSALLGIGGGTLNTPWMVWHSLPLATAIATSSVLGVIIATAGTLTHLTSELIQWSVVLALVSTSLITAPLGAMLVHRLPTKQLKRGFSLLLVLLGITMIVKFA